MHEGGAEEAFPTLAKSALALGSSPCPPCWPSTPEAPPPLATVDLRAQERANPPALYQHSGPPRQARAGLAGRRQGGRTAPPSSRPPTGIRTAPSRSYQISLARWQRPSMYWHPGARGEEGQARPEDAGGHGGQLHCHAAPLGWLHRD